MRSLGRVPVAVDRAVVGGVFLLVSALKALWHPRFLGHRGVPDPQHRGMELRKVLLVHTPNLIVSLSLLAIVGSNVSMRFHGPFDDRTNLDGTPLGQAAID